jgi:polysaccharide export outer membrane protein
MKFFCDTRTKRHGVTFITGVLFMSVPITSLLLKISIFISIFFLSACSSPSAGSRYRFNSDVDNASKSTPLLKAITPELIKEQKDQYNHQNSGSVTQLKEAQAAYLIDSGDILSIVIWGHPELAGTTMNTLTPNMATGELTPTAAPSAGFIVDENGSLQFPFAGDMKVSGLTEGQARDLLASKISRYIKDPRITLRVQAYRSKRIYIDGEVKVPGLLSINDIPMTLVEAINRAGGVLPTADQSQITVNRGEAIYKINFPQMMKRGEDPSKIMLRNGDVVRIPSRDESKVFVTGEVVSPKSLTMHDGRLTLNEALGESGGINPITGDGGQVYVVRNTSKEIVVFQLDANTPAALAIAENFELIPKDLVYVAATALTNWNRTISLIFPNALSTAVTAAKVP